MQPDVSVLYAAISEEGEDRGNKINLCPAKVQYSCWAKHRTCRRFLSNGEVLPLRHTQRSGRWQVVCCFENGDNCPEPRISKMASVEDLTLHSPTRESVSHRRENNKCGNEHEWMPNVQESWELEHIYAKQVNFSTSASWGDAEMEISAAGTLQCSKELMSPYLNVGLKNIILWLFFEWNLIFNSQKT